MNKIAFVVIALLISVAAAILIVFKFQAVDEKASLEETNKKPEFPRWVFNDSKRPEEASYKSDLISKIDTFWREFEKNKDKLNPKINEDVTEFAPAFMDKYLHCMYPALMWQIKGDPNDKNITNLTITAEAIPPLRPIIDTMMERAPKLKEWRFHRYRPAFAPDEIVDGLQTTHQSKLTAYEAKCELTPTHKIDVTIFSPDFEDSDNDTQDGYKICELALGEENTDRWAGKFKMIKRAVKKDVPTATKEFVQEFNALKQSVLAHLPDKPYYDFDWQKRAKYFYVLRDSNNPDEMKFTKDAVDINKCIDDKPFHSDRYSKTGEKFCLLISAANNKLKNQAEFDEFLNEIDDEMKKAQCGGTWGHKNEISDKGVGSFDVDLFVSDIPKCTGVLKKIIERRGFSHDSLIIFHDTDLSYEWIGLFDDTTPPLFGGTD